MTLRMLEFIAIDTGIDDEVDESFGMSKGRGGEDPVIIICVSCVLYLQLSLHK